MELLDEEDILIVTADHGMIQILVIQSHKRISTNFSL